eukprot:3514227-Rhodomonas_salina.1
MALRVFGFRVDAVSSGCLLRLALRFLRATRRVIIIQRTQASLAWDALAIETLLPPGPKHVQVALPRLHHHDDGGVGRQSALQCHGCGFSLRNSLPGYSR